MSTKTSIKRIALVAAAALTLGGLTAVSAHADNTYIYGAIGDGTNNASVTLSKTTLNGVAGPANSVAIGFAAASSGVLTLSGNTSSFGVASSTREVVNSAGTSVTVSNASAGDTVTVNTPVVGSITVNFYKQSAPGVYSSTITESVVITVGAAVASGVYSSANTTAYLGAGETFTALTADASAISAVKTYSAIESATATLLVNYKDGVSTGSAITYTAKDSLTATITSGPGTIYVPTIASAGYGQQFDSSSAGWPNVAGTGNVPVGSTSLNNYSATALPDPSGRVAFMIFANNQSGVTTVTVKNSAGTVVATKTLTFTGTTVASVSATVKKAYVGADTALTTHGVLAVTIKDSSGNPIVGVIYTPTATYSSSTFGSVVQNVANQDTQTTDSTGTVYLGWAATAGVYGPVTITLTDPTTSTISTTATITNSSKVAATVTITAPATVNAGDPIAWVLTAKDKNGYALPDGTVVSATADTTASAASIVSAAKTVVTAGATAPDFTTATLANGSATVTASGATVVNAAAYATFLLQGTAGTATTNLASTLAGSTITVNFSVTGGSSGDASLALDAANAATDAANNAYDEAQNATQAASDALAAVKALAVQVKALIALVTKIKNKVGA